MCCIVVTIIIGIAVLMSLSWTLTVLVLHGAIMDSLAKEGYYTVVSPRILRPNSEYHLAISMLDVSEPTNVYVDVGGKQDSGGFFTASESVRVQPFTTEMMKLKIGDIGPGNYTLNVRGEGGLRFQNTTVLNYVHKSYSVFIQTDKAIYKPGHKVQFRAIALNSHLKPSVEATLDIHITDGKGNRVKQWTRAVPSRGVFSGEFELSESPVLGDWMINVKILDQTFSKMFTVAEYVLPKFEVIVDAPKHVTFKESSIVVTVKTRYTYGRAVKGEATISAYPTYVSDVIQPIFQVPVRKVVNIDGKATVKFDIAEELKLVNDYERQIKFDVTVKEELTGRMQNNSAETMLHKHKYSLELVKTSEFFKPGLKYTAFIKLAQHDGTPIIDKTNPVKVFSGFSYNFENYTETQHMLSSNGIIEITYYPPVNASVLGIAAEYLDVKEWFSSVQGAISPSNSFIQATVKTTNPKVNDYVELEVNSTTPLKVVTYQVLGRGDVIIANSVNANGKTTASWSFQATFAMAPTAHVVVQYIREDGEVVADALDIELDGSMQNFVDLDVSTEETQPGNTVEIKFSAKPMSYVGFLGVDQSVLLLKSGNDISKDDVLEELSSYDSSYSSMFSSLMRNLQKERGMPLYWWPGSLTAAEAFQKSGALIMTNGYVHDYNPGLYYRSSYGREEDLMYDANGIEFPMESSMPAASFGAAMGGAAPSPSVRIRKDFTETWIWEKADTGMDGRGSIKKRVPDTITSWVISAFSVDPIFGFGLIEAPKKVNVFRPFFISLDLPYSVLRGETISVPVVVFNYMDKAVQAEVVLENSGQFEFADISNEINEQPTIELYRKKKITVQPNSGTPTSFMITPKELGYITIKVTAKSSIAGDGVERKLLVKPEGETQFMNKAFFVDLRNKNTFETNVTLDIPVNIVPGSEFIEVAAVGDILGPSLENLKNLIKMPFGCGEQNMLNFVPNIVILNYLSHSYQLTPAIETKAKRYMEAGYQQELTYKHNDGSFSAFGTADPSGSTWLTAFVAKSFYKAMPHINVEEKIITDALEWLASKQEADGSFPEVGVVSHKEMQGGAGNGLALTAYVLTTFLENKRTLSTHRNVINKATDYIVKTFDKLGDDSDNIYTLSLATYALHLAQHPGKDKAFGMLETKANTTSDMKWWTRLKNGTNSRNPNDFLPNSIDIEMTAYAMLTYLQRGLTEDCVPIMKWLISQQNDQGGFASTQDTVVALGALADLAADMYIGQKQSASGPANMVNMGVKFSYGKGISNEIRINSAASMILHKVELPRKIRKLNITATGRGFAIVYVAYRYNVNVTGPMPLFDLDPQVDKNSNQNHLQLSICSRFTGGNESNMAVMEVVLPSGYTVDSDALPSLKISHNVKRIETKEGDSTVVLYFDKLTRDEICPTISAFRTHKVAKQRPVPVLLYDYYDQSRKARTFYEARTATLADICEGEDCQGAAGKISPQAGGSPGGASFITFSTLLYAFIPLLYFLN